jgi:hypothetical protein
MQGKRNEVESTAETPASGAPTAVCEPPPVSAEGTGPASVASIRETISASPFARK